MKVKISKYQYLQIDWTEPFLQGVVAFHLVMFLIVILTRSKVNFQGTLFVVLRKLNI